MENQTVLKEKNLMRKKERNKVKREGKRRREVRRGSIEIFSIKFPPLKCELLINHGSS